MLSYLLLAGYNLCGRKQSWRFVAIDFEQRIVDLLAIRVGAPRQSSSKINADVKLDVEAVLEGFRLQQVRRFFRQIYWENETLSAVAADAAEPGLKLESVASHSWHVADAALLLAGRFPTLNVAKCVLLSVVHDKLEMYTGDFDPVGDDGSGRYTHAFDQIARSRKQALERDALSFYLNKLSPSARVIQQSLIEENFDGITEEARFVKAVDKIQALAFVVVKKNGDLTDDHLNFSINYSLQSIDIFPKLINHYAHLVSILIARTASHRALPPSVVWARFVELLQNKKMGGI